MILLERLVSFIKRMPPMQNKVLHEWQVCDLCTVNWPITLYGECISPILWSMITVDSLQITITQDASKGREENQWKTGCPRLRKSINNEIGLFTENERQQEYGLNLYIIKVTAFVPQLTYLVFVCCCFFAKGSCVQPLTRGRHWTRIAC